jgi:hypothetical protein
MTRFCSIAKIVALFVFIIFVSTVATWSQQVTGTILGRVTDSTGSVVPGATIQIQNPAIGFSRTDQADSDGRYLESSLPLGTYSVTVQKAGFQTLVHSGIAITVGSEVTVNAELAVGDVQQHVEVTGEAPAIETSNATLSGLVSQDQLRDLPLNGRSVDTLALLSPGIFANRASAGNTAVGLGLHFTVNGARQDWNLYLLDGTVTNDALSGRSSAAGEAMGVEGILEFRILTHSFSAEYGRTAGGVVSAVTRSGTNDFHGSAYEFVRNTVFNSQNVFAKTIPPYHRNQFGAAVGGPIFKNKLFFFANYEGLRGRQAVPSTTTVPTQAAINTATANFSPSLPYLLLYPSPSLIVPSTISPDGLTGNVVTNFTQPSREDYTMTRLDYKISDKDSLFARYVYDPSIIVTAPTAPGFVLAIAGDDRFLALGETHIFSPSTLNEFRFAVNRTDPNGNSYATGPINSNLLFVPGQVFGSIAFTSTTNGPAVLSSLGTNKTPRQDVHQNLITESDTVTTVKGAHTIKFGFDVEREQINQVTCTSCAGAWQLSSLPNFLTAKPTGTYTVALINATSTPQRGWRRILFGAFAQDDIRLRPNLTLNLGLRWEFYTNPSEIHGYSSANINITDPANTPGPPFLAPKLNFAPRVGLAWDPTGSGKTSIRVGGGVYDNQLAWRSWFINATNNASFLTTLQISNTAPFPNGLANGPGSALQQDQQVQYYSKEPTVYEYNLEVQRQLFRTLSLRAGYVGSHGLHLPAQAELNTKVPTLNPDGSVASFSSTAPATNPKFATMQTTVTSAVSNYNALQVLLEKTASAGLTFQASYTYSKAQSNADQITSGQINSIPGTYMNPYDPLRDYSLSAFDQRHTLVVNGAYQMPWDHRLNSGLSKAVLGGWAINGIYSFGSGVPLTVIDGYNASGDGDTNNPDRPNLKPGFSANPTSGVSAGCSGALSGPVAGTPLHTPNLWFDPCAFYPTAPVTATVPGTFGNLGRNTVAGPRLSTLDFTLVKTTTLTERIKLEFRAEAFNLMNHPNFGLPNNAISSKPTGTNAPTYNGNVGQISTTSVDNRELQLGLKLLF